MIAQLSVETGVPQSQLWRQPAADTRALITAVNDRNEARAEIDRWTITHELLAQIIDVLSLRRTEAWRQVGVPAHKLPKPYRVKRPDEPEPQEVVMTPREAAKMMMAAG